MDIKLRKYQEIAFNKLKNIKDGGILLVELPTGYGKTFLSLYIAKYLKSFNKDRLIHVVPTQALVINALLGMKEKAKNFGLNSSDIAGQMMLIHEDPFFLKKVIVTTYNTFLLNASRLPTIELDKIIKRGSAHVDIAIGSILNSIVVFDEIHIPIIDGLTQKNGLGKSLLFSLSISFAYAKLGVPILYLSATFPPFIYSLVEKIASEYNLPYECVKYEGDKEFENTNGMVSYKTQLIKSEDMFNILDRSIDQNKRVAIVLNSYNGAIELFTKIEKKHVDKKVILLHSGFKISKKQELFRKVGEAEILISTQVIEVGVDVSFDTMITELAPAASLIQRIGRVARYGGEGEVYIIKDAESKVYPKNLLDLTLNKLNGERNRAIDWRYPQPREGYEIGTRDLLETYETAFGEEINSLDLYISLYVDAYNYLLNPLVSSEKLAEIFRSVDYNLYLDNTLASLLVEGDEPKMENIIVQPTYIVKPDMLVTDAEGKIKVLKLSLTNDDEKSGFKEDFLDKKQFNKEMIKRLVLQGYILIIKRDRYDKKLGFIRKRKKKGGDEE